MATNLTAKELWENATEAEAPISAWMEKMGQ